MCFSEGLKITLKCSVVQPILIPCLLNVFFCICSQYEIHSLNLNIFKRHCTIHSVSFQLQNQAFVRHYIFNAFLIQLHLIQMYIAQAAILHSHNVCCCSTRCTSYCLRWHLYSTRLSIYIYTILFLIILQAFLICKASLSAGFLKSLLSGSSGPWYIMMILMMLQDDDDADGYGHHHDH